MRFLNLTDPNRMVTRLDNLFVEGVKIHVNYPKFKRDHGSVPRPKVTIVQKSTMNTRKFWVKKQANNINQGGSGKGERK